jgi:VanZ family protein
LSSRLRSWGPALLWAGIIFALSSQPTLPVSLGNGRDKIAHFTAYAVLGLLIARALPPRGRLVWLAILLGSLYGASDEFHQHFVPGRSVDVFDWVADSLGAAAGTFIYRFWWGRRQARRGSAQADPLRS